MYIYIYIYLFTYVDQVIYLDFDLNSTITKTTSSTITTAIIDEVFKGSWKPPSCTG